LEETHALVSRAFAVISLLALTLLPAHPLLAGTYSVVYTLTPGTGNTAVYTLSNGSYNGTNSGANTGSYTGTDSGSAFTHYGGGAPESFSILANDIITATFTWQPTNGDSVADPPPAVAIVRQTALASWSGGQTGNSTLPTGDCGTGLPASVSTYMLGYLSKSGSGTLYSVQPSAGSSFTVACTPTASSQGTSGLSGSGNHGDITVTYSASASPVTVTITGTTPVGGSQALTGQQLTAVLNVPPGFSVYQPTGQTGYQWTIVGKTVNKVFKNYDPYATLPSNQLTLLTPADLKAVSPSFYDSAVETVNATCTVTLVAPDGVTPFPVTVKSKDISVLKPTLTAWGIVGGWVQHYNSTTWGLAVNPNSTTADGMTWSNVNISVPTPFSGGKGCFVQTVTPDHEVFQDGSTNPIAGTNNKKTGLDSGFPYGPSAGYWTVPAKGSDIDGPGIVSGANLNGYQGYNKLYANDTFTTYVMYNPPAVGSQGTVWVPLKSYNWGFSCTVLWQNNSWVTTLASPQNAASVPNFAPSNTDDPPTWPLIQSNY
jgi:hypothetical protein